MEVRLNRDESALVKGAAILMLMVHHYSGMGYSASWLAVAKGLGPLICCLFFFCSGYGLSVSSKNSDIRGWLRRIFKLIIPFILANAIYMAYWSVFRKYNPDAARVVTDLLGFTLINRHCWFLQALIMLYLSFAISSRLGVTVKMASAVIAGALFTGLSHYPPSLSWLGFPLGIMAAHYSLKISRAGLAVIAAVAASTFYIYFVKGGRHIDSVSLYCNFIVMIIASIPVWVAFGKVVGRMENVMTRALSSMGGRTMDFYMMHGLCLLILVKFRTHNQLILIPAYIAMLTVIPPIFHMICSAVLTPVSRLRRTA